MKSGTKIQKHVYVQIQLHLEHFLDNVFHVNHLINGHRFYINVYLHQKLVVQIIYMMQQLNLVYAQKICHLMMDQNVNLAIYQCIGIIQTNHVNTAHNINILIL